MKKLANSSKLRTLLNVGIFVCLVVITIEIFPHHASNFKYHFEIGKPWGYELLTAEFDFPIYKTDAQLDADRKQVAKEYIPYYSLQDSAKILVVSIEDMERITKEGWTKIQVIDQQRVATTHLVSELYTPKSAYVAFGKPLDINLTFDEATSKNVYENMIEGVSLTQGLVQRGEKIIDTGEIVNEHTYQILFSLREAYKNKEVYREQNIYSIIGHVALICIFLALLSVYLIVFRPKIFADPKNVLFFSLIIAMLICITCITLRFTSLSVYLIPFAWAPILVRVFFDSRTALFVHIITVVLASFVVSSPFEFIIIQIAIGMVSVSSLKDMTQRAQLATTAVLILIVYTLIYTAYTLSTTGNIHMIDPWMYLYFAINALLVILAYGFIYLCEKAFGYVSSITLVELTNVNSDLMLKFAEQAPGTFQHSLQVSNLATEAAKKIGAKILLVRTGALYHDIGKMMHPELYTENQQDGANPLLDMSYEDAAAAIISHVTEGVRLARKHHLPDEIVGFIECHHGTSKVKYFYNSWLNAHPGEKADEARFTYPGPCPFSKETAILMMADAVEARSRSLKEYTEESISSMVETMIEAQVTDGQLKETSLSFKDLEVIKQVFKDKLIAIYHHRITYPELVNTSTESSEKGDAKKDA